MAIAILALAGCQGIIPGTGVNPVVTELPSAAVAAAQAWLAQQAGVTVNEITILDSEAMDWSDSCLGLGLPNESCLQAVTPGWQVVLQAGGVEYTLRTDADGTVIRQAEPVPTPGAANPLNNTQWKLVSLGSPDAQTPALEGTDVTLAFNPDGQAGGSSGCNSYGGGYTAEAGSLAFEPLVSTLMACAEEDAMRQEQEFVQMLQKAQAFELAEDQLVITTQDGLQALTFQRAQ